MAATQTTTPSQTNGRQAQPTFGRYAETPYDQMTPEQQEAYPILAKAEGGVPQGPAKIWIDYPKLATAVAPLADHFHQGHHSLTQREREIAVCVILGKWRAAFPCDAHDTVAIGLGISPEIVAALLCGQPTRLEDHSEQTVYEVATALADARWIPRSLFDRAVEVLGNERISDLTVLMGMYTAVAFVLKFYDVPAGAAGIPR